jgi:hypothetical protein
LAITLNDEENVKKYVQSFSFADEIIFIDGTVLMRLLPFAKNLELLRNSKTFDDFATNVTLHYSNQ